MTGKSIKCVAIGDGAVGKTCMVMSYCDNRFPVEYVPTVFDNYAVTVTIRGEPVDFCLFDTAGQEEYDRLRILTYPKTDIFLVCFAVNAPDSLQNARENWVPEIREYCPGTPYILVGTKADIREDPKLQKTPTKLVSPEQGRTAAKQLRAATYVECSARTQKGLHDVFNEAIVTALQPPKKKKKSACIII